MVRPGLMVCAGLASALMVPAQGHAQQAAPIGYTMPQTQVWEMRSAHGAVYRIFASVPKGEPPADGFPVLYLLDGNAIFASFAETRRMLEYNGGKAIVIGVGYPTDDAYDKRRTGDYIYPVAYPGAPPQRAAKPGDNDRDRFLDFLTGALRTEVGKRYKIDLKRQSLFGHSFGGLFALHALFARPDAFQSIVSASPSLGWNTQEMLQEERDFGARLAKGEVKKTSRLMIVVGDRDTDDDPEPARALFKRLDLLSAYGLGTRYYRYDRETHMTVPARAVTDTLRFAFQ